MRREYDYFYQAIYEGMCIDWIGPPGPTGLPGFDGRVGLPGEPVSPESLTNTGFQTPSVTVNV